MVFTEDLTEKPDSLKIAIQSKELELDTVIPIVVLVSANQNLNYRTGDWEHVEIKSNQGELIDQYDRSTLTILLNGNEIVHKSLQKKTISPYNLTIKAVFSEDTLLNRSLPVYNNVNLNRTDNLPVNTSRSESIFILFLKWAEEYALILGIAICTLEVLLGVMILIGWRINLTLIVVSLLMVFFTFLTWYSAYYDKVTDCGCFGNAIPLKPWESFYKDVLLSVFILFLILNRKFIKPFFSQKFSFGLSSLIMALSITFAIYCWTFLPLFNFLKFKEGNDIQKLSTLSPDALKEIKEYVFIYRKDGAEYEFTQDELAEKKILENDSYVFIDRRDKIIQKGEVAAINDFVMLDENGRDLKDSFFRKDTYKLLMVSENLKMARPRPMKKIAALAEEWTSKSNLEFWALTSESSVVAEAVRHEYQLSFKFCFGDQTNIKSIIRSNPGLLLIKKSTVVKTWPSTNLPNYKTILKSMK